jgi:multisubunit Na+/H+ antiporter MnhE subunit
MLKKLISLTNSPHLKSHLYKILFLCFALALFSKYITISYMSIVIISITYIISSNLNLRLDTDIAFYNLIKYIGYLLKEIFFSTINISKIIWSRNCAINPKFDYITTQNKTELGITIFANSITLTPGTLTILIDNQNLLIHALKEDSIAEIKNSEMDQKIKGIFI